MPSFLEHVENALGRAFASNRGHDDKLFTKTQPFNNHPKPTITVSSPECGDSTSKLQIQHTPLGENLFPELTWKPSTPTEGTTPQPEIAQYLVVVEDPDAPLPSPIVHGTAYRRQRRNSRPKTSPPLPNLIITFCMVGSGMA